MTALLDALLPFVALLTIGGLIGVPLLTERRFGFLVGGERDE